MRVPVSTYRLQISADFDLNAAAGVLDYVTNLGADWLYLSPLLSAESGSEHGYDVVAHASVDAARGGPRALARLAAAANAAGRGILVDIVPNHMGVATPRANAWWWDLLMHGQGSRYAEAFDVDWAAGDGKICLPVLGGDGTDDSARASELDRLEIVGDELRYFDNAYPLAPGSADDGASARVVHERQHYRLMGWRLGDTDLNYRRFFGVNSLAGIRVEVPWVFAESHAEIIRWMAEGLVQGLRVDHPDGLADPGGYLDLLREATSTISAADDEEEGVKVDPYVLVEKILDGQEQLPANWSTAGTTGYDALADFDRVLVDPAGQGPLDALEARLHDPAAATPTPVSWAAMVHDQKRAIADGVLRSEVLRLARLVAEPYADGRASADAIAELLACFPVYRSYLPVGAENLQLAGTRARTYRPDLSEQIDRLLTVLGDPGHPAAVRFQQTSGMVMAKGVEDTSYYRFSRLTSLNEVGADPEEFAVDVPEFHRRQQLRQAAIPTSMTTLSTHDTKRGEDVRARISVLAEIPEEWQATLGRLRAAAPLDDAPFENLLWQAIVGSWPASPERLCDYALKAAREASTSTDWTDTNEPFEQALRDLVAGLDGGATGAIVSEFVDRVRQAGWSNSLAAKLLQLTAPGVPDVYQGSELWETSLVDPDNRRPVDFGVRRALLENIDDGWLPPIDETGAAKLLVTSEALRLRRDEPERFTRYAPVAAFGAAAVHVIAFERGAAITVATRLPLGLAVAGGWGDTTLLLAGREYLDVLTGSHITGGATSVAEILERYPVALLIPNDLSADAVAAEPDDIELEEF